LASPSPNILDQKGNPSQIIVDRMVKARAAATASNTNYFKTLNEGVEQFNQVKELYPGQDFWHWAEKNYPPLAAADNTRKRAATELENAMKVYYGPDAAVLSTYIDNITNAQGSIPLPG
jgi:hypothetical protein